MPEASSFTLNPPTRIMLTPGPSNIHPRVQRAFMAPLIGHMDPYFAKVIQDSIKLLREVFQTKNEFTIPLLGSGTAGINAGICNFLEPGDTVVVGVNGYFADRTANNAIRTGAKVVQVAGEWGKAIDLEAIEKAMKAEKKVKALALVHAETSTGVLNPMAEAAKLARKYDALFIVDAVSSMGGQELPVDEWGVDVCYSGSQKCLSASPGLAPITVDAKAMTAAQKRTTKFPSFYFDLPLMYSDWAAGRFYHHTAPVLLIYALHEALAMAVEEGTEARIKRHFKNGSALHAGLEAMGLKLQAEKGCRAQVVTAFRIPAGIDDVKFRMALLEEFGIEIAGGLGQLKGQVWRIGLMGYSSSEENVMRVLMAMDKLLTRNGYKLEAGAGLKAALAVFQK